MTTNATGRLTEAAVRQMVLDWYRLLDRHAPLAELLALLADGDLVMRFPEGEVRGHAGFTEWYERVTRVFFDEVHTVTRAAVDLRDPARADVDVVVSWQARTWDPPAAQSVYLGFDAYQSWVVENGPAGTPVITTYVVDELRPLPGSATL